MTKQFIAKPFLTSEHCQTLGEYDSFQTTSVLFAHSIEIKALTVVSHAQKFVVFEMPDGGLCLAYHYGVLVFFNTQEQAKERLFSFLKPFTTRLFEKLESESIRVEINKKETSRVEPNKIFIKSCTSENIELIADVLSKSIKMDQFEQTTQEAFSRVEPIAHALNSKGKLAHSAVQLLKHIGNSLLTEHEIIGRIEMTEKPHLLWENPELEPLYLQMMDEFEILDRHAILDKKIELIARTAQTSLEVLQHRHASRLEWYIIILILVSICLEIYALISH